MLADLGPMLADLGLMLSDHGPCWLILALCWYILEPRCPKDPQHVEILKPTSNVLGIMLASGLEKKKQCLSEHCETVNI